MDVAVIAVVGQASVMPKPCAAAPVDGAVLHEGTALAVTARPITMFSTHLRHILAVCSPTQGLCTS